ncbi:aspartate aminotransferase family protein [uncultured Aquitalea sp.]|uniref:aspartate aminotransferase family protein n=1 Tax=uncultured Aquitalea sp. TaxID=540272 RepID=UPI0025F64F74|nr:aspartate aminotransferase family protein [uncultured Aquitalea sp.]
MTTRHGINWDKAQQLHQRERELFVGCRPLSRDYSAQASEHLLFGVPLHWMDDWSTPFTLYVKSARGARFEDVDGNRYVDFCLGDTGAMFGHSPEPVARAVAEQAARGITAMLPSEDAVWVSRELARRFGLPYWQFAMTATDANRFALRWARAATRRKVLLVFNGCYHGTIDDVFVDLVDGQPVQRASLLGQVYDLKQFTRVVEFNDLAALEAALKTEDVACLLAEPALTNIGMVLPEPGFWKAAQALCKRYGTLLIMDETHTISTGMGGYTRTHGLQPDMLVVGKPVGGGVPCAVYGFSAEMAERAQQAKREAVPGHSGIGTTLTANMLAMAAMRANLAEVMTEEAYQYMFGLAESLAEGLRGVIARHGLPWCVTQVGARTEFQFTPAPPKNGSEADAILDSDMEHIIHLFLLNRGLLITPFHNMILVCPDTKQADVDQLVSAFDEFVREVI